MAKSAKSGSGPAPISSEFEPTSAKFGGQGQLTCSSVCVCVCVCAVASGICVAPACGISRMVERSSHEVPFVQRVLRRHQDIGRHPCVSCMKPPKWLMQDFIRSFLMVALGRFMYQAAEEADAGFDSEFPGAWCRCPQKLLALRGRVCTSSALRCQAANSAQRGEAQPTNSREGSLEHVYEHEQYTRGLVANPGSPRARRMSPKSPATAATSVLASLFFGYGIAGALFSVKHVVLWVHCLWTCWVRRFDKCRASISGGV